MAKNYFKSAAALLLSAHLSACASMNTNVNTPSLEKKCETQAKSIVDFVKRNEHMKVVEFHAESGTHARCIADNVANALKLKNYQLSEYGNNTYRIALNR